MATGASEGLVWLDGKILDAAEATVAALDHGLTVGDGVFETLLVMDHTPFALSRHLARLKRSASVLGIELPLEEPALREAAGELLVAAAAKGTGAGRLRITVTGGPGVLGSARTTAAPTVILAVAPGTAWPATERIVSVPWVRNERSAVAGAKTTSYAENVVALAHAQRHGAGEAVFANSLGALCEGTGSNIFLCRDDRLLTPALVTGCLAGITRELVCELVPVEEVASLTFLDLRAADEVFLTSSTRNVQAVSHVDDIAVPSAPGSLTRAAAEAFAALVKRDLDP